MLCMRMVCNCRRLIAERKVWRGYARMDLHGTRLRLPEDGKPYPLRLKKCQASHARHNERMLIMRRRSASGATAGRVSPCRTQLHDSLDGADKHCSRTVRPSASIGETRGVDGGRYTLYL